jgi:PIN domain nuclease of toxin-antitoxin system
VIVLDTHVWLWWLHEPRRLSRRARTEITQSARTHAVRVSAISLWEIAVKSSQGKVDLGGDIRSWFALAREEEGIVIEPVGPADAIGSVELPPPFHRDPADRIIVALARRLDAALVTNDRKILAYPHVRAIS